MLKNLSKMNKFSVYLRKPIFEKLFRVAEYSKLTKEERKMYDVSLKRKWDNKAALDYARLEGEEKGKAKAEAEKKESAIKMLGRGFEVKLISEILGMSVEEIERLK
ncbi:PD-(D/E)XK nuclease family transposase [Sphingobacterium sp. SGG-5]|uniref:PD-(D/E)XK nuclease family transposase n=1 Tax=Sphingobacterium sp. SGG-5 TaxID=2710881 RepID=UPI00397C8AA5